MNDIDIIRKSAEQHQQRYRSFDVAAFMGWAERQPPAWLRWSSGQTIPTLNRQKRFNIWDNITNARRLRYTSEPPEDGPT